MVTSKFDRVWSSGNSVCFNSTFYVISFGSLELVDCSFTAISHGSSKFELLSHSTRAFETMVTRSKNARKLDYLSSLLSEY